MTAGGYRRAQPGDDLTQAMWRPLADGSRAAWVPAEPLGWQDARPRWLQKLTRLLRRR